MIKKILLIPFLLFSNFIFSQLPEIIGANLGAVDGTFQCYAVSSCLPMDEVSCINSINSNWMFSENDPPEICALSGNPTINAYCKLKNIIENDSIISRQMLRAVITSITDNDANTLTFNVANLGNEINFEGEYASKIVVSVGNQVFKYWIPSNVSLSEWYPIEVNYCNVLKDEQLTISVEIQNPTENASAVVGISNIEIISNGNCVETENCPECSSFELAPSQEYIISGWAKVTGPAPEYLELQKTSYSQDAAVVISFMVGNTELQNDQAEFSGEIIDGWQRFFKKFKSPEIYPDQATMKIYLDNLGAYNVFFDDIRIHPVNANLKSFVYDQETQKLLAELDENNYATFYEYDKEGGLVRVKKETEKGIFTIQETRSSTKKIPVN